MVAYDDKDGDLVVVVVQLLVQVNFELELPRAQHEVFAYDGTRLSTRFGWRELDTADVENDGGPKKIK